MDDLSNEDKDYRKICDEDVKHLTICGNTVSGNISKQYLGNFFQNMQLTGFKFNKMAANVIQSGTSRGWVAIPLT